MVPDTQALGRLRPGLQAPGGRSECPSASGRAGSKASPACWLGQGTICGVAWLALPRHPQRSTPCPVLAWSVGPWSLAKGDISSLEEVSACFLWLGMPSVLIVLSSSGDSPASASLRAEVLLVLEREHWVL